MAKPRRTKADHAKPKGPQPATPPPAAPAATPTISVEEFGELMRVTPKTVNVWIRAGMPVESRGSQGRGNASRLELKAAITWYMRENGEAVELNRQRSRLAREQADAKALENAARRRDLVPLSMIEREFSGLLAEFRTNALAIPSKVAPELEGLTVGERQATLERAVFELLDRAAGWSPGATGQDPGSPGAVPDDVAQAADADCESVGGSETDAEPGGLGGAGPVEDVPG